jgi:hypothetical protein
MKLSLKNIIIFISILTFLSGCGKNNEAPDPPQAESTLVVELFNALRENDYSLATQKVKRMRMLNPRDFSLANIEYQIEMDSGFTGAQRSLDKGDVIKSKKVISATIAEYGNQEQLLTAEKKIKKLVELQKLTDRIRNAKTSSGIAIPTGELNRFIAKNKIAVPLKPFAEYSLDRARTLMSSEDIMGLENLKADIDVARVMDSSVLSTMMAELAIEEAQDKMVQAYEKQMSKNWDIDSNGSSWIKLDDEILYFRVALSADKELRDKMFSRLLLEPPGDFSSMMLRAFILKKSGYSNEAEALAEIVRNAFNIEKYQTEGWFKVYPDQITDFNSLNPFVLYPFFVYCEPN